MEMMIDKSRMTDLLDLVNIWEEDAIVHEICAEQPDIGSEEKALHKEAARVLRKVAYVLRDKVDEIFP